MKRFIYKYTLLFVLILCLAACHGEDEERQIVGRTVIVLMPSADDLKTYLEGNVNEMAEAVATGALTNSRLVVCKATGKSRVVLIELWEDQGKCVRDTIRMMESIDLTTATGIMGMLMTVKDMAPAHRYSLVVGGHGMAWLPAGVIPTLPYPSLAKGNLPLTRWIGGKVVDSQTDISTLSDGIKQAGMHMDYILFDDCHMSSVEVAYELREVTDYLIGCPTEIMAYGFPYRQCLKYITGNPDYKILCETFHDFYSNYKTPCGTVAVTDCRELEKLALLARNINESALSSSGIEESQRMDGYEPPLFYDLGDVYSHLSTDSNWRVAFYEQLERTIPFKAHTPTYYSANGKQYEIKCFSGLNTSQGSKHPAAEGWKDTQWYQAIHK